MTIALSSPVTGGAQTGLTSPTYTHVADSAPDTNAKQWAVSALGGTQASVRVHSGSDPFTITFFKPKAIRSLGFADSNGNYMRVPMNRYRLLVRKGVIPATDNPAAIAKVDCYIDLPAGADVNDPANIRAMISLLVGALNQLSAGLGDTLVTNVM
jgi:hypothetical protein